MRFINGFCKAILLTLLMLSSYVFAGDNTCTTVGGPKQYTFNMGTKTITDPSQDTAGTVFPDVYSWAGAGSFNSVCSCSGTYTPNYKGDSTLPLGHRAGSDQYYKVNDSLEVLTKISLASTTSGTGYFSVPFQLKSTVANIDCSNHTYKSGSDGRVTLYIAKPFVGSSKIGPIKIASMYISSADNFGAESVADIILSGIIVVPQNCEINAGTSIVVDLGTIVSSDFKGKGTLPEGYKPRDIDVAIKCNNIASQALLKLYMTGTPSPDLSTAIVSNNKDIGVIIADSNGTPLSINSEDTGLPFALNDNLEAQINLTAWPTSTTGSQPSAGKFQSTAQINVTFN